MIITKEIFEKIRPGEIFRIVTTRFQEVINPMETTLTFVAVKARSGTDWFILAAEGAGDPDAISRFGRKVHGEANIRAICPCDDEVLHMYEP